MLFRSEHAYMADGQCTPWYIAHQCNIATSSMLQKLQEVHGREPSSSFLSYGKYLCGMYTTGCKLPLLPCCSSPAPTALLLASASMVNNLVNSGNKSTGGLHNRYIRVSKALYLRSHHRQVILGDLRSPNLKITKRCGKFSKILDKLVVIVC